MGPLNSVSALPGRDFFVERPLGLKPIIDRFGIVAILLLDPRSSRSTENVRVADASVLVNLAEEILAIDQLQGASPESLEADVPHRKLFVLVLGDPTDEVSV